MLLYFSDHEWTTGDNNRRAQTKASRSSGVHTSYLKLKSETWYHTTPQNTLKLIKTDSSVVFVFKVCQLCCKMSWGLTLQVDSAVHLWIGADIIGTQSSSGQGSGSCSSTWSTPHYPTKNTANHSLKNLSKDGFIKKSQSKGCKVPLKVDLRSTFKASSAAEMTSVPSPATHNHSCRNSLTDSRVS